MDLRDKGDIRTSYIKKLSGEGGVKSEGHLRPRREPGTRHHEFPFLKVADNSKFKKIHENSNSFCPISQRFTLVFSKR